MGGVREWDKAGGVGGGRVKSGRRGGWAVLVHNYNAIRILSTYQARNTTENL